MTLSNRGGRGQNKITILGVLEIMTSLEGRGGYRISVTISMTPLGGIFRAKINLIIQYLVLKMTENCEESSAKKEFFKNSATYHNTLSQFKQQWWDPT